MIDLNTEIVRKKLAEFTQVKEQASLILAEYFGCSPKSIFYRFLRNELTEKGTTDNGDSFFFHGYGCSVENKNTGFNAELEFGPGGEVCSFDKYSLCNFLGYTVDDCSRVVEFLITNNLIRPVDEDLYNLSLDNPSNRDWDSEEQEMDFCVADRLVISSEIRKREYRGALNLP